VRPSLYIVAGPPGSGKSRAFPVSEFGVAHFNADDRAASLNGGSYHGISLELRARVNREFEAFIQTHLRYRESFAFETTLRSEITFKQIADAVGNGFDVTMLFLGTENPQINIERIAIRWGLGFHAAPPEILMATYLSSMRHLRKACREAFSGRMRLVIYDNTAFNRAPVPAVDITHRSVRFLSDPLPRWVGTALAESEVRYPPSSSAQE
jgi:predicted ABC-type ATPase